jgi:hypothetical protein
LTPPLAQDYTRRMAEGLSPEKRMTRLLYAVFIAVVTLFVVSNIVQVSRTLFWDNDRKVTGGCAAAVASLVDSVETAERDQVWARYPDTSKACDQDPNGADALAAAQRYARAAARHKSDLGRVRRAAESFIR